MAIYDDLMKIAGQVQAGGSIHRPATIMMSQQQFQDLKQWSQKMDVVEATSAGIERGKSWTAAACVESRVAAEFKTKCKCGCPIEVDAIFCHTCMRAQIMRAETDARQDSDFGNGIGARLNAASEDPACDPSVLWDAFEAGIEQGVNETLEKMVPADKLMTMAQRAADLDRERDGRWKIVQQAALDRQQKKI